MEPVVAEDSEEYALREEDLPKLFAEYDKLAAEMVDKKKIRKGFQFLPFYDRFERVARVLQRDYPAVDQVLSIWLLHRGVISIRAISLLEMKSS